MALGKRQLQVLCIVNISQAIMLSLPFTIAVYMVRHFFEGGSEETIGRMTGALAASYSFAQFASSYPLGLISNRFGRKPVVLMGVVSSAVALIAFGNAPTYSVAAAARVIGGLLNGTVGAWKCMVGEKCTPTEQGQAMGWLSLSWGVGNILGPSVGGYLTNVCERWEAEGLCAEGGLLRRRPFLLPCLFGGAVCLVATLVAALFLQETLPSGLKRHPGLRLQVGGEEAEYAKLPDGPEEEVFPPLVSPSTWLAPPPPPLYEPLTDTLGALPQTDSTALNTAVALSPFNSMSKQESEQGHQPGHEQEREAEVGGESVSAPRPLGESREGSRRGSRGGETMEEEMVTLLRGRETEEEESCCGLYPCAAGWSGRLASKPEGQKTGAVHLRDEEDGQTAAESARPGDWHKNKQVLLTIAGFTMCSLVWCTLDETVPIFASAAPAKGGLGMKFAALSLPIATGGMTTIIYAVKGYPRLQKKFGAFMVARGAYCLAVVVCMLIPSTSLFLQHGHAYHAKALLVGTYVLKALAQCSTFTSAIILVNAACHPSQLGAVNGVAQMLASLVRGIGPATSGNLWAISSELHHTLHQFLPFAVVAMLSVLTMALYGKVCQRLRK